MATGLLVIRLSRPFAAKSVANWVMKRRFFYMALAYCRHMFRPYFGPHQYSDYNYNKSHINAYKWIEHINTGLLLIPPSPVFGRNQANRVYTPITKHPQAPKMTTPATCHSSDA